MGHVKDRWYVTRGGERTEAARHGVGLRWQVWYRVDGREKCGGSFRTKALAERKLLELESSVQRGQWVDPTDQTTVAEYLRMYAATRTHSTGTRRRIDGYIRCHVEATPLGGRRLAAVRPSEMQAWVTDRAGLLAPTTLRQLVKLVRSAFAAAALDRLVAESPFQRVTLPRAEQERIVPLTVAEVRALAAAMPRGRGRRSGPGPYRAMVIVQAGLGLRIGELLALRVEDVDFLRRSVRVEWQIAQRTRERVPPKTPRSRRTLPLPRVVAESIAEHLREFPPGLDGLLFHTAGGLPLWHEHYGTRVFKAAVAAAGLPAGTTSHDLRHHYASVLLAAGESVVAVAERLGHENATLVLTTYGHLMPDSEDRTRKAIEAAWSTDQDGSARSRTAPGRPR